MDSKKPSYGTQFLLEQWLTLTLTLYGFSQDSLSTISGRLVQKQNRTKCAFLSCKMKN